MANNFTDSLMPEAVSLQPEPIKLQTEPIKHVEAPELNLVQPESKFPKTGNMGIREASAESQWMTQRPEDIEALDKEIKTWTRSLDASTSAVVVGKRRLSLEWTEDGLRRKKMSSDDMDSKLWYAASREGTDAKYNKLDKEVDSIYRSFPKDKWEELDEAESFDELIAIKGQMDSAMSDERYMSDNHDFMGTMGMYAAASVFDPLNALGYGIAYKAAKIPYLAAKYNKLGMKAKAGVVGGTAAVIEGLSEAEIQGAGLREYDQVAYTGMFAFALAGGGKAAVDTLKNNWNVKQQAAYDKLSNDGFTIKNSNPDEYRSLLDIVNAEDAISPYRSKFAKFFGNILPDRLSHSPSYLAWQRGGSLSALAATFDTLPGLSTKTDVEQALGKADDLIYTQQLKDGKTAMDVKYELMEQTFYLDKARREAFDSYNDMLRKSGDKPMGKEEFSETIWKKTNENYYKYTGKKVEVKNIIEADKDLMAKTNEKVDKDLETDEDYLKLKEEDKKAYRDGRVESEIDVMARDKMKDEPEFFQSDADPILGKMVEASNNYYGFIAKRMNDAGIKNSEYFDPRFYQPRMYNKSSIENNVEGAREAFEDAIRNSYEYKNEVAKALEKQRELIGDSADAASKVAELEELRAKHAALEKNHQAILNLMQDSTIGDSTKAARISRRVSLSTDIMSGVYRGTGTRDLVDELDNFDQLAEGWSQEAADQIAEVVKNSPTIKHLTKLTGVSPQQILLRAENAKSPFDGTDAAGTVASPPTGRISIAKNQIQERVIIHEMLHHLTQEGINSNPAFKKGLDDIRSHIRMNQNELAQKMGYENRSQMPKDIAERVDYMLGIDSKTRAVDSRLDGELISVALETPEIAIALNKMEYGTTNKVTIFKHLKNLIKNFLGIDKMKSNSVLGHMFKTLDENAHRTKADAQEFKFRDGYRKAQSELVKIDRQLDEGIDDLAIGAKLTEQRDKLVAKSKANLDKIVEINKGKISASKAKLDKVTKHIEGQVAAKREALDDKLKAANDEVVRLKQYPKKSAKTAVDNIVKSNNMEQIVKLSNTPPRLKGRNLTIDPTSEKLQKFMQKDEAGIQQAYHYGMSGRIAVQHATGFTEEADYMKFLADNSKFDAKDSKIAQDLFALTKGTRQLQGTQNETWQTAARMVTGFNYITMGGQFAKYGMSEIGAGIYTTGLGYLKELIPALGTTIDMYKGKRLTQMQNDLISMTEAGDIYSNNSRSKYSDTDFIESTFSGTVEKGIQWGSKATFRYSGLEGITTLTRIALPRAYMRRLLKMAEEGRGAYDMLRWGISPEDMQAVAKQPIKYDDNGIMVDFNFGKWDPEVRTKFQLSVSRMARDSILQPDAIRVPAWMNDGSNIPFTIIKQFMTFTALANERLMLRGFSENRRGALVGSLVSMGIIGAMEKATEELAVATGLVDPEHRRYDLDTEEGRSKLARIVAFRHSFAGAPFFATENIDNYANNYNGADRVMGQAGGPTIGRALNIGKAANEYISEGKIGTASQVNLVNGIMPFRFPLVANYANEIAREVRDEAKQNRFYKDQ